MPDSSVEPEKSQKDVQCFFDFLRAERCWCEMKYIAYITKHCSGTGAG